MNVRIFGFGRKVTKHLTGAAARAGGMFAEMETLEARRLLSAAHHGHLAFEPRGPRRMAIEQNSRAAKAARREARAAAMAAGAGAQADTFYAPLTTSQTSYDGGSDLLILGDAGNDQISVTQSGDLFTIKNGTWSTTQAGNFQEISIYGGQGSDSIVLDSSVKVNADLHGGAGNDTLVGGGGTNEIYGGPRANLITAGPGNDTIVTIGSTADTITGGSGLDSFWIDDSATEKILNLTGAETAAGTVHKVGSFLSVNTGSGNALAVSKTRGTDYGSQVLLSEPTTTQSDITYSTNFSTQPLFASTGPSADDVNQGYVGDCYFLSTLSSVAHVDPNLIQQSVVSLGDGTYAVQFDENGQSVFVRVDGMLPTWSGGQLAYANEAQQNSIWVAIMEKAFAVYRDAQSSQAASYNNLNAGWMSEVYSDLGCNSVTIWNACSPTQLLQELGSELAQGDSLTMAVNNAPAGSGLISDHAYMVVSVQNVNGSLSLTLRNPWGGDGSPNGGYITVSADQAYAALWAATYARV